MRSGNATPPPEPPAARAVPRLRRRGAVAERHRRRRELAITQPALSRQIHALEDALGCALFVRRHRSLELTPEGTRLFRTADAWLDQLGEAIEALRPSDPTRWPSPPPAASPRCGCSPSGRAPVQPSRGGPARRGQQPRARPGAGDHRPRRPLLPRRAATLRRGPAVRRGAAAGLQHPGGPGRTGAAREGGPPRLRRSGTSAAALGPLASGLGGGALRPGRVLRFTQYEQVIQSALAGHGAALGRLALVRPFLDSGQLVAATARGPLPIGYGYWLVSRSRPLGRNAGRVRTSSSPGRLQARGADLGRVTPGRPGSGHPRPPASPSGPLAAPRALRSHPGSNPGRHFAGGASLRSILRAGEDLPRVVSGAHPTVNRIQRPDPGWG